MTFSATPEPPPPAPPSVAAPSISLPSKPPPTTLRIKEAQVFPGVCPYCAVGCAQLIYVKDGTIIDIEGDPDTPHTEGALCPKGSSTFQLSMNARRLTKALYRAPGSAGVGREAARLDDGGDCAAREGVARRDVCRNGRTSRTATSRSTAAKGSRGSARRCSTTKRTT